MYHFVGCAATLRGISLKKFKGQLNFLKKSYPNEEIFITFDHGTIDHLKTAVPELERRNLKGIFFILTMCPEEYRVATVDKQRQLEASLKNNLLKLVCSEFAIDYEPEQANKYLAEFKFYSLEDRYLRYLRDNVIPKDDYAGFVSKYFNKVFGNEREFVKNNYLSWKHISHLHKRGHIIGSHSHYHDGDKNDFDVSLQLIEKIIKQKPTYVSYPNGKKIISDADLIKLGVKKAYISSPKGTEPFRIGRIDCNNWSLK